VIGSRIEYFNSHSSNFENNIIRRFHAGVGDLRELQYFAGRNSEIFVPFFRNIKTGEKSQKWRTLYAGCQQIFEIK